MPRHLGLTAGRQDQGPSARPACPPARARKSSRGWLSSAVELRSWATPTNGAGLTTLPNGPLCVELASFYYSRQRESSNFECLTPPPPRRTSFDLIEMLPSAPRRDLGSGGPRVPVRPFARMVPPGMGHRNPGIPAHRSRRAEGRYSDYGRPLSRSGLVIFVNTAHLSAC